MLERFGIANIALIIISGFFTFMVVDFGNLGAFDYVLLGFYAVIVILGVAKITLIYRLTRRENQQKNNKK